MSGAEERHPAWALLWIVPIAGVLTMVAATLLAGVSFPALFMAVAATMLVLALAALYQSFRGVFGDRGDAVGLGASLPARAALLDEKHALLRAIKDVAYEHEVGKLSREDFQRLDRAYRLRAKEVLRALDEDLAPFLDRAEALVSQALAPRAREETREPERVACPKCETSNAQEAEWCKECGARVAPVECAECGASNEPDAKFCIKCASALASGDRS